MDGGGHLPDWPAVVPHRPLRLVELDRRTLDLDAGDLPAYPLRLDALQGCPADEVLRLVEVDSPSQPDFVGVVLECHVGAVVENPRLDPADVRGAGRPDLVGLAGADDSLPELVSPAAIAQVDLVPDFARPAGSGHHDGDRIERCLAERVVGHRSHPIPEQVGDQRFRLRTLELKRPHIGFHDVDLQTGGDRDPPGP